MTIDITPEAVEHLCAIHEGYEQHGTVATLRALSAALTTSQAKTAAAYDVAADMIEIECDDDMTRAEESAMIRALIPADSKAALDRMIAEARKPYEEAYQYALNFADFIMGKHYHDNKDWRPQGELMGLMTQIDNMIAGVIADARADGMREALDAASDYTQRVYGEDWKFLSNPIDRERILASIPKGTSHE